jgi:hypothetical protein
MTDKNKGTAAKATGPAPEEIYHGMNVSQRIWNAQEEVTYIQKEKKAGMNYSIVSHDAVTAKVRPVLHKWGVIYWPADFTVDPFNGNCMNLTCNVRFQSIDEPHDYILVGSMGQGIDKGDKAAGKAISYATKYALLKVMGMATGDDPDLDQESTYESGAVVELRSAIKSAGTNAELEGVSEAIKAIAVTLGKREPASLQVLRQEFAARKHIINPPTEG